MKLKTFLTIFQLALLVLVSSSFKWCIPPVETYTISIEITNIRNAKGTMQIQLYKDQKSFAVETPEKMYRISKSDVSGHTLRYEFSGLTAGTYGLALLDDENSNKKMDYGWVMPEEGFGFSDYYHTGWSKPTFYNFKFYLDKDKSVKMKVRYL